MGAERLPGLVETVVPAFVRGLRTQGDGTPEHVVRRVLALVLTVFSAFPAIPFDQLDAPPTPALAALVADRAAMARMILHLLRSTS